MKKVLAMLLRPPTPQLAGLAILSAVIFYGGRSLRSWHGLSDGTLQIIVGGVWLLAAGLFVWRRRQAQKRARMIEDRLRGQAHEHKQSVRPDKRSQVEELERQLGEALTALKSSKMGNSALYSLPWYVIIGPPGSGKTTLLRESGLSFPQMTHGRGVRGVGGTRNCDWWFTDQGILLDTAGRYTTQDEDRKEWLSFLEMLKKARAMKPINGAIIAISIADLITANDEQLAEHARKVRERLAELTERLEVVFPIYVLFSKCDLLEGFVDMFGGYGKKDRAQTWGFTMPYLERNAMSLAERFDREFDQLHSRLCAERLQNLGLARSQAKKARIFSFPMQFALAKERLRSFLAQLDQPNPYHESSDIRGFYFTSGTQEGQPLDRVLAQMRKATGLEEQVEDAEREPLEKKAYFIDELFTQVVFPDKDLAQSSAKAERRRWLLHRVGMIATGVAALAGMVLLVAQYAQHSNRIDRASKAYAEAATFDPQNEEALRLEERRAKESGGPLEQLRRVFVELDTDYGTVGSFLMGQTNALYEQRIRPLYVEKVQQTFVEPLQQRLRAQLREAVDKGSATADDATVRAVADRLTCYRMLGGELLLNRDWLGEDFLKRADSWTWRLGEEVAACRPHRETFVARVVGPMSRDWTAMPEEALIPDANKLVTRQDVFGTQLRAVLEEQGQAGTVSWTEILKSHPEARLLDDSIGITAAFVNEAPLDDILEQKGELLGENSGEALKLRRRQAAIDDWKQKLAEMRPRRKSNLAEAMADVHELSGDGQLYVVVFEEVCSRLRRLGLQCNAGDTAWLVDVLKQVHALKQEVDSLTEASPHLDRIVPAAKEGRNGALEKLRRGLKKVIITIRNTTGEHADPQLRDPIQSALMGLCESLHYALAREIIEETNKVWNNDLGRTLAGFSQQFPFKADSDKGVDPGRFDKVFAASGEFDSNSKWINYLADTLQETGFGGVTPSYSADRRLVARLQQALFARAEAGCNIEFLLEKRGNMSAVLFSLGDDTLEAKRRETADYSWRPAKGASVQVIGYQIFNESVNARIEMLGTWGFLRLLASGERSEVEARGNNWQMCKWSTFLHPQTKQPLVTGEQRAEAALLFRTSAEPNPLAAGFFTHQWAEEVFLGRL